MRLTVHVKPGLKKGPLVVVAENGTLTVFLKQRAVDGAANDGLVELLAKHFKVAKSRVQIESGHTSRIKRVSIDA
jgi:uncharacterized protein (TIGR00251 family)